MTPEKQRIAIAEACGYTHVRIVKSLDGPPDHCIGHHPAQPHSIPDYLNDLNAIHEAKQVLYADQLVDYVKHLAAIHPTFCVDVLDDRNPDGDWHYEMSFLITATAAQRAEAFLRTIGKWEASK